MVGLCRLVLWFDDVLFGHWNRDIPDVPAAESKQTKPDDGLQNRITKVALLPADLFGRIGRSALGARECRCIDLMFTSTAGDKRHFVFLIQMATEL